MNKTKQFWTLLKFQPLINPFIFFMLIAFATPLYLPYITGSIGHDYHPSLDLLISNQNLFFVAVFGAIWLVPESFQFGAANGTWTNGTEFLLTRAVDRSLLLRARIGFFYLLIVSVPVLSFLIEMKKPDLQISEYSKILHQQVLDQIPGSIPAPVDKDGRTIIITIPHGGALVAGWHIWIYLIAAITTQMIIFLVYPVKYRQFILWAIYLGVLFTPLFFLRSAVKGPDELSTNQILFFSYVSHQVLFWVLTIFALLFAELWCERRFARFEQ